MKVGMEIVKLIGKASGKAVAKLIIWLAGKMGGGI